MSNPWMKFYPQDWRADEKLRNCSLAARGLWIEMVSIMHRSEHYGYLLVNGRPPSDAQLAVQVGALPAEVSELISSLETEGVFSRDRRGWIYSRRMIRDAKRARKARENGSKGGNPNLSKQTENQNWDNQEDKPQKPEARDQKEKEEEIGGADAPNGKYVFQGQIIRLESRHFNQWAEDYHSIADLKAELRTLDGWWQDQSEEKRKKWFHPTMGMLNKKHQANLAAEKDREEDPMAKWMP